MRDGGKHREEEGAEERRRETRGEKHPPPSETDTSTPLGVGPLRRHSTVVM